MPNTPSDTASGPSQPTAEAITDAMTRAAQGDAAAFKQLYALTIDTVTATARSIVVDQGQTQEVVQEVYLELWRWAERFDPARGAALPWVLRIVRNRSVDRVRHCVAARAREQAWVQTGERTPAGEDTVLDEVLRSETYRELRAAVQELTERQRQTVWLTYFDHLTGPQISGHLSVPLGTVKSRLRDGVLGLRAVLAVASD